VWCFRACRVCWRCATQPCREATGRVRPWRGCSRFRRGGVASCRCRHKEAPRPLRRPAPPYRAEWIGVVVALIGGLPWSCSAPGPLSDEPVLLADPGPHPGASRDVLKPDFDRRRLGQPCETSFQRAESFFKLPDDPPILSRMTQPGADVRETKLLRELSRIAWMAKVVEASPDREKDDIVRWRRVDLKRVIAETEPTFPARGETWDLPSGCR
jgi:hypothetical protein